MKKIDKNNLIICIASDKASKIFDTNLLQKAMMEINKMADLLNEHDEVLQSQVRMFLKDHDELEKNSKLITSILDRIEKLEKEKTASKENELKPNSYGLLPCIWCKYDDVYLKVTGIGNFYIIKCSNCDTSSYMSSDKELLIPHWNKLSRENINEKN